MKTIRDHIKELEALPEDQKDLWALTPVTDCDDGSVRLTETMIRPAFIYGPEEGDDSFLECTHNMKLLDSEDINKINPKKVIVIY